MSQKRIGLTERNKEDELLWESREARASVYRNATVS